MLMDGIGTVEGYANCASAMPGETVGLCCAGRSQFSIEVALINP